MIASSGRGKAAICCNAKCCNGPGFANVFMALRQWEPSYPSAPFMQVPCRYLPQERREPEPSSGADAADAQVAPQRLERTKGAGARRSSPEQLAGARPGIPTPGRIRRALPKATFRKEQHLWTFVVSQVL